MKTTAPLLLIAAGVLASHALACEPPWPGSFKEGALKDVRPGTPNRTAVRAAGVVAGYGTLDLPQGHLANNTGRLANNTGIPTLRIRIDDIVSGRASKVETDVALMDVRSDCASIGTPLATLQGKYPVGSRIVVFGETLAAPGSQRPAVLAETNHGGYVGTVPHNPKRIASGELDFAAVSGQIEDEFIAFEFDRALLMLADAPAAERFARLRNLARHKLFRLKIPGFDRESYRAVVAGSGVTTRQQEQLMKLFDQP